MLLVTGGGVNDGRSLASALMLGASGVWVGTRFIPTVESKYPELAKQQYGFPPLASTEPLDMN